MRYQWIVFDADDTLFDFGKAEQHAVGRLLTSHNVADTDTHQRLYRGINKHLWQELERGAIAPGELKVTRIQRFFDEMGITADPAEWADHFLDFLAERSHLLEGAESVVTRLATHAQLGILTNGLTRVQRSRLERSGLAQHIAVLTISEEVGASKPAAAIFEAMEQAMQSPQKSRVLMVGDRYETDIIGARRFGWDTAWLSPELPEDLEPPTFHLTDIRLLPGLLLED
ncbi:YjjG family noncanonical pyrimidine nucleotidase [Saccharospirillum alexandrii]|uniref:YjjG family noncanonical pyrimidine nucleotidase n=1 Tax=Saccharospirillum alexandrii TaxID=2448477 RepID=UPI000FD90402|nr:YjjG family noncanonical pyrimidine nucleotidase [Saccharospirillum alexandrii]